MSENHSEDGAVTPRALPQGGNVADITALSDILSRLRGTYGVLGDTFNSLNAQSASIANLRPNMSDAARDIDHLRTQIRAHSLKQDAKVKELKKMVREGLKDSVTRSLSATIKETVRDEIAKQVQKEVEAQIREHLPVPLDKQAEESKRQLKGVKDAWVNSEARKKNSNLSLRDLEERIGVVLKGDGTKCDVFPVDLRSLFYYDGETAKKLVKDYGLPEDEIREININRFMTHVGIPIQLVLHA